MGLVENMGYPMGQAVGYPVSSVIRKLLLKLFSYLLDIVSITIAHEFPRFQMSFSLRNRRSAHRFQFQIYAPSWFEVPARLRKQQTKHRPVCKIVAQNTDLHNIRREVIKTLLFGKFLFLYIIFPQFVYIVFPAYNE